MSGGSRCYTGTFFGTGASIDVSQVGFKPRKLELNNVTSGIKLEFVESMADASGIKTLAAGTRSLVTVNGVTLSAQGFTLGTDSVNGVGEKIVWAAWD
jgi:hypothetical protein